MMQRLLVLAALLLAVSGISIAEQSINALRGDAALSEQPAAPRLGQQENNDSKRQRNYPMQPPTIPHKIDGYAVNLNANRCLACHSRRRVEETQAPMVSVTHYMDRDGNFLANVSPRRYFCNQCHVAQSAGTLPLQNTFQDMDALQAPRPSEN